MTTRERVLAYLRLELTTAEQAPTRRETATALRTYPANVQRAIDELVDAGLIEREPRKHRGLRLAEGKG